MGFSKTLKYFWIILLPFTGWSQTSTFGGYIGGNCGVNPSCSISVNANATVNAKFDLYNGLVINHYYVSPTGSDSNPGTSSQPWATIAYADTALILGAGGTVVHVRAGTYSTAITTAKSGTYSAHITYICDTAYSCVLNPNSFIIWQANGAYTDVIGFDFNGSGHNSVMEAFFFWTQDGLFQSNRVHNIGDACNTTQNAAVGTYYNTASGHGNRFLGNLFYHTNCGAGHPSSSGAAMSVLAMDSYDTAQNNIILDHGGGYPVQISHGFAVGGVYTCVNGTFTNNTILNADRGILLGFCNNVLSGYTVSNNIVANIASGNAAIRAHEDAGCGNSIIANNLIYGASPSYQFDSPCTNTSTGTQSGSNSATFVNYTGVFGGDYHSKAGSTAIDNGTTSCVLTTCIPSTDFDGVIRSKGVSIDIGAYEFVP